MNKKEKCKYIQKKLNELFPHPAIPLSHTSPYTLLIAVLLSAQCTDKCVNKVTPYLFSIADTPEKMIQMQPQEIQKIIKPCGLSTRKAQAIFDLSKILIDQHQGEVPKTMEELEELPGVGHKTASVVMIQAFNQAAFPVDTHIHRIAQRWGLSNGKNVKQTEEDLKKLFPKSSWNLLHLQMIYYARAYCMARCHDVNQCPICLHLNML